MVRALLLLLLAADVRAQSIDMLVYASPGLFDVSERGVISGPGAHVVKRVGETSGIELRMQVMPAARILQTLVQQPGHCSLGIPRVPAHEPQLAWAGVVASSSMMLYGRLDEIRTVAGVNDLRGASIAAQRESLPAAWLRERGLKMQEVRDSITGLRMLQAKRVDYWLVNELVASRTFQSLGNIPARALHNFGRVEAELACHRDTPPAMLARLRSAVERLRQDGELTPFGVR